MNKVLARILKPRGVHGGITVALVVFGLFMMASLAFQNFSFGYASAIGVVWLVLLLIFAVVYLRVLRAA